MKRFWLLPLLSVALLLAACADGGAAQTPGALGTEPVLGTDTGLATQPGLGTDTGLETAAVTDAVEPTLEATTEPTVAATAAPTTEAEVTPVGQATAEVETGIVAAPFDLFTVASLTGQTDTGTGTGTGGDAGAATPAAGTQEPAGTAIVGGMETDQNRLLVRASELLGSEIVDSSGETVGTVSEVLVDQVGLVQYVVFDASEFMGLGTGGTGTGGDTGTGTGTGANTPEPIGTLDNSTQVVGTIEPAGTAAAETPEAVATNTVGDATAVANLGAVADEDTILVFNGAMTDLETMGVMLPAGLLDGDGTMLDTTEGDMPANVGELNGLIRMTQITDGNANVLDTQEQDLGEVEDLLVDIRQGMVEYGVVDFGGFLGIAENTVAVPWQQFTFSTAAGADADLMLDVNEETLQNAPQLDMGSWESWPTQIPMDWETETRTFWETAS